MSTEPQRNNPQDELWNSNAGHGWVASQALIDQLFAPFDALLVEGATGRVLDVGCGTGGTTVAIARRLGALGRCTGVDLSAPMITAARARAERDGVAANFIVADAQTFEFGAAAFDSIVSRFGVMFFADSVAAFARLRRAAAPHANLCAIAWRSAAENPFMTTAERAAASLLPQLPTRRPNEPGQFAFEDRERVAGILNSAGWASIHITPIDVSCAMPASALDRYVAQLGPVGRILQGADDALRARVLDVVRPAFDAYIHGADLRFTAACWLIGARAVPLSSP